MSEKGRRRLEVVSSTSCGRISAIGADRRGVEEEERAHLVRACTTRAVEPPSTRALWTPDPVPVEESMLLSEVKVIY
jgi:hypothetical protein